MEPKCLICGTPASVTSDVNRFTDCLRCGKWELIPPKPGQTRTFDEQMGEGRDADLKRSNLSSIVRRQGLRGGYVPVQIGELEKWGLDNPLPTPRQQCDEMVRYLGDNQVDQFEWVRRDPQFWEAWIGTLINNEGRYGRAWLLTQLGVTHLIEHQNGIGSQPEHRLTYEGWERYEQLRQISVDYSNAFIAMQFGDPELDSIVEDVFMPAVKATGFTLKRLIDNQPAGLIDDQLRVQIRNSVFVIADLTHENRGAYWEAGFAEGLGKPVIYTCRKDVWDNPETKPHFDTNHLVTIIWDPNDREDAAKRLKATIRATLPTRAVREDAEQ